MGKPFWKLVNSVISQSDVVLEVLDARMIEQTRNKEIEERIEKYGKILIHVVNKVDLVNKDHIKRRMQDLTNPVFISARDKLGTTILKNKILEVAARDKVVVGVVGYPNTGKSSVINALAGGRKAKTSSTAGFTRAIQKVKSSERIMMLDTPGVFPFIEKDSFKHALTGSKNAQDLKDPDLVAMEIIKKLNGRVERHYGVPMSEDYEQTLENIAKRLNRLLKGGLPDIDGTARTIVMEWQRGKIK